jgi:hypothetical protein
MQKYEEISYEQLKVDEIEKWVTEIITKIGFSLKKTSMPGGGTSYEYIYQPDYLQDNHYTLVIFKSNNYTTDYRTKQQLYKNIDYRLYTHNKDGKFVNSPFQIGSHNNGLLIKREFKKVFKQEFREMLISDLIE